MKNLLFIFVLFFIFGCSQPKLQTAQKNLALKISSIDISIIKKETTLLSKEVFSYSKTLQKEYKLISPPLYHNFLVNLGVKKRGLCWHFTFDLLTHLKKQNYKSFDYYIVGANINDYWKEHNALLVTCQGCEIQKGVIIDLWRNSGEPYFVKFGFDSEYKWSLRGGKR